MTYIHQTGIKTDNKLLTIILQNLLNNALKYSNKNSEVLIKTFSVENLIKIQIIDYGIGIDGKYLKIFLTQVLIPLKLKKNSKSKGTGLGLKVCKEFIQLLNGKIEVDSKKDKGTTFTLTFDK